jgi:hypothetical protein
VSRSYPLSFRNDRPLPPTYEGPAFVWDIDKTYLSTHFSSWQGLLRIPLELSVDKQAIPGMPEVLRSLRRGAGEEVALHPIYFISASPPFLRSSIEGKMLRDGVENDGITFKDWLRTLLELRPDRLFEQVGFKTAALLRGRLDRISAEEYLFGDDYEKDAEAFSIYAAFLSGELDASALEAALAANGVAEADRRLILNDASAFPAQRGRVKKIFIHLERNSRPESFERFGTSVVPVRGAYQLALVLEQDGLVGPTALAAVREALREAPNYRYAKFEELEQDAKKRGILIRRKTRSKKKHTRAKRHPAR